MQKLVQLQGKKQEHGAAGWGRWGSEGPSDKTSGTLKFFQNRGECPWGRGNEKKKNKYRGKKGY